MANQSDNAMALEQRSIDYIPADERHGKPWHLFTLWFPSNLQINALVTGALAVFFGLSLPWAIFSIIVGNLVGALFMAYHSVQGPRLGVPQMIQSRAQFGFFGNILPVIIVVLMYLGFAVEGGVVVGAALAAWIHISRDLGIVIFNVILLLIALVGYNLIHAASRIISVISAVAFVALFIQLVTHLPANYKGTADTAGTVLLAISVFVSWQVTWAPYVSDYSRYLPESTPARTTFFYTYFGSVIGATVVMVIGAFAAVVNGAAVNANAIGFLGHRISGISALMILALLIGLLPAGAEGPYGAFLTAWSAISPNGRVDTSSVKVRALFVTVFTVIATVLAILAGSHLLTTFENITLFLLYLLVPWTAINLTDYYFVRRGNYDIGELFKVDGEYRRCNWGVLAIYVVSIGVEIPFVNSSIYVGPLVSHLGGADIAWIVGIIVSSILYYAYARATHLTRAKTLIPLST
ncbi:MAG: purine-cytosine permease family protein [Acidimicrobiales bacterium]